MIYARDFSPDGQHAGTDADPWPGVAIKNAVDSLNDATDTVRVSDGIWRINEQLQINHNNWTLEGESRDGTILRFEGPGQLWFGAPSSNTKFTTLTADYRNLPKVPCAPGLRFDTATNHQFTDCKIFGHAEGGMPGTSFQGCKGVRIANCLFNGAPAGGDNTLQLQPLGADLAYNSDCVVEGNTFDSTYLVAIGISNLEIRNNTLHNQTMANSIAIQVCGMWNQACKNVTIDGNTLNIGASNFVAITGLPNDPGGASVIDGFNITNNTLNGTFASIYCQSFDPNNYNDNTLAGNEKHNVVISGNTLHSAWGASGIDCRGGAGLVDTVLIENNTLTNDANATNSVGKDANTKNLTVRGNTGIPNDSGGEPIPPDPQPEPEPEPPTKNTVTISVNCDPPGGANFVLSGATPPASKTGKGKPSRPPAQPPTVSISVMVDPPDSSNIVIVGNAT